MNEKSYVEIYPVGYFETMAKLRAPDSWDVPGIVQDVRDYIRRECDIPHGQVLAVLDFLAEGQSRDLVRELLIACRVGLQSLRASGLQGRTPETDTLEAAIQRAKNYF